MTAKKRPIRTAVALVALAIIGIASWNYWTLQRYAQQVMNDTRANHGIRIFAHYQWLVNPKTAVFDLRSVSMDNSATDVSRVLLQFANKVQHDKFDTIILSYKGSSRFMLEGSHFRRMGAQYQAQDFIYTLRTLPQHVLNLDGSNAFGTWTGGWIAVMSKQFEDLNAFHRKWYAAELR